MTRETECMIDRQVLPGLTRYEGKMIGSDVQSQAQGWGFGGHTHSSPELKWVYPYSKAWTTSRSTKLGRLSHQDESVTKRTDVLSK